jgi:hypothetical protein
MATHPYTLTSWVIAGTAVNDNSYGVTAWVNPGNATADDDTYAVWADVTTVGEDSNRLKVTNFDFSSIPDNAWVDGFQYKIDCRRTGTSTATWNIFNYEFYNESGVIETTLRLTNGATYDDFGPNVIGEPFGVRWLPGYWGAASPVVNNNGLARVTIGSEWNASSLFGLSIVAESADTTANGNVEVDHVAMRARYHEGFPALISTGWNRQTTIPPILYNGRIYVFNQYYRDYGDVSFGVVKSGTDPSTGKWTHLDTSNEVVITTGFNMESTSASRGIDAVVVGTTVHCVIRFPTRIDYKAFDLSTETWGTSTTVTSSLGADYGENIGITVKANGDILVIYNGATEKVMGGDKGRVDYARSTNNGSSWTADVALDAAGDIHYGSPGCRNGDVSNYVWLYWGRQTSTASDPAASWGDYQTRTHNSSATLSAVQTSGALTDCTNEGSRILLVDDGTNWKSPYFGSTPNRTQRVRQATSSSGVMSWSSTEFSNNTLANAPNILVSNSGHYGFTLTLDPDNGDIYMVYVGGSWTSSLIYEADLYYAVSTDGMATWSTPTLIEGTDNGDHQEYQVIGKPNVAIYTRSGTKVLGIVYDITGGMLRYTEISLSANNDIAAALSTALTVAPGLSAKGSVAAAVSMALTTTPSLSSPGILDAAASLVLQVASNLTAAGQLQAANALQATVLSDLTATGQLSAANALVLLTAANLTARGSLDAAVSTALTVAADVTETPSADLLAALQLALTTAPGLDGRGALSASNNLVATVAANILSVGEIQATTNLVLSVAAALQAVGQIDASNSLVALLSGAISGSGSLSAAADTVLSVAAGLDSAGDLSSAMSLIATVAPSLDALGQLQAAAALIALTSPSLTAIGSIDSALSLIGLVAANVTDADNGDITAALNLVLTAAPGISAGGSLLLSANTVCLTAAALAATGNIEAAVDVICTVAPVVSGAGELQAAVDMLLTVAGDVTASGNIQAAIDTVLTVASQMSATGSIAAALDAVALVSAPIASQAGLTATLQTLLTVAASSTAEGQVDAAVNTILSVAGDVSASGDIQAAADTILSVVSDLSAQGDLLALTSVTVSVAAAIAALGNLDAATDVILTTAANITAAGNLQVTADALVTVSGLLTGLGQVDAAMNLVATVSAAITDPGSNDLTTALIAALTVNASASGSGALQSALTTALTVVGQAGGAGSLDAAMTTSLGVLGTLESGAPISASLVGALTITSVLNASGALDASAQAVATVAAGLAADGQMAVALDLLLTLTPVLNASGDLDSALPIVVTVAANIVDGFAVAGDIYNAAETFPTGSNVTISLYDPITSLPVGLDNNFCIEIGATGLYVWNSLKLTTQPAGYKEYVWTMTDGVTTKGGVIRINAMSVNDLMSFEMENGETFAEQIRLIRADAAGKIVQAVDGSYAIRDAADSKDRIVGDDSANGGRDIISTDGA